jgi:hypothetical protein
VRADGSCPRCHGAIDAARARPTSLSSDRVDALDDSEVALPWHFKLLAGALALYLGYRALQGIEWLTQQL